MMAGVLCIGNAVQDFVFSVNSMPGAAEKYRATAFETVGGGPAATAAVAIARLGGKAMLAARLGDDRIAEIIIAELEDYGVDCSLVRRFPGRTSSLSAVIVDDDGERLIVNYLDSGMPDATDWLPDGLPDGIDAVLADTRWPAGGLHALQLGRRAGVPAVLDGDVPVPEDSELVSAATHVAFSASGLVDFCNLDDPRKGLHAAAEKTDAWCCVTLGNRGTLHIGDGEIGALGAYKVDATDTLGAGDVWHGAFTLALAEGQEVDEAMHFAAAAAAIKVRDGGGRAGSPLRTEVEALMQASTPEADL